ncbi:unnamed protein product [Didymodactylos carnosus]|uniref:Peroxisomal membrane protein 11C n=1 Tax=Didymodactylos carnosus TaxID=1234261 RepID=A0A813W8G8_9BILA|nr:unnamed protein product [Didymodactylos carnosus]CAF3639936.1 unnamed protein product [Didymodactylos carnosus]
MESLINQMDKYSSRNLMLSFSQYTTCLTAGCLPKDSQLRERLINLYMRLGLCRTINRSLDFLTCLHRCKLYGLGDQEKNSTTRLLTLLTNISQLIYYPSESIAWLCEAQVFKRSSQLFRAISLSCWLISIIISIIINTIKFRKLHRQLNAERKTKQQSSGIMNSACLTELYKTMLGLVNSLCFLLNCIHWFPYKILWSGKLPLFVVGFNGTLATLCSGIQSAI